MVPGPLPEPPLESHGRKLALKATWPDSLLGANVKLTMGRRGRPVRYPEPAAMCGHGPFLRLQASVSPYAGL